MAHQVIPENVLCKLRGIGDPDMTGVLPKPKDFLDAVRTGGLLRAGIELPDKGFKLVPVEPEHLEVDKLQHAQRLFATYGAEIAGALLLAALPQTYAARWGPNVLVATTQLHRRFRARILGTAQFLVAVMQGAMDEEDVEEFWLPGTNEKARDCSMMTPWKACLAVRCYHEAIRVEFEGLRGTNQGRLRTIDDRETPLNQEDLLATLLTFTITVFEVLERYGITWTPDDQEAYLHAWDIIGRHLGIGYQAVTNDLEEGFKQRIQADGWHGLRPATVTETRHLMAQLRERHWPKPGLARSLGAENGDTSKAGSGKEDCQDDQGGTRAGRILVRALIDELAAAMPRRHEGRPLSVMRALAPDIVRQRLNLGGGGIVMASLDLMPKRRALIDQFTAQPVANAIGGRFLRLMANDVVTHVVVHFVRTRRFRLPGLEEWSHGLEDGLGSGVTHR